MFIDCDVLENKKKHHALKREKKKSATRYDDAVGNKFITVALFKFALCFAFPVDANCN